MKLNGAQLIVRALEAEGITHGFGIPGTHNIELYDALAESETFESILVTDEQSASFMADGYARASGKLAVVNVVPGAGLTHAMSGIAEAYMDCVPMLVLACGIRQDTGAAYQLHDIDQVSVARPVVKKIYQPRTHKELYRMIREASRVALSAPAGPTLVEVPVNLYLFTDDVQPSDLEFHFSEFLPRVDTAQIEKIARLVNESESVAIYAGSGAQHAGIALLDLAEKIDAVVYTTISGKGVFPEDHPRFVWNVMGPASPKALRGIENELDCLIAVGCRFGEVATASYGNKPPEKLVHIDIDASVFHKNFPAALTLQADAREALEALAVSDVLQKKPAKTQRLVDLAHARDDVRKEQGVVAKDSHKVSPHVFLEALQNTFGPEAAYVVDSGNGMFIAMEHLRLTRSHSYLGPVDYSCMGYSVPAAIGAKLACPHRPVVGLIGDGAFLMTGMELVTAANYGVPACFFILRDGELSQIAQFQRKSLNRETLTNLFELNFGHLAKAVGMDYLALQTNQDIAGVLNEALSLTSKGKPVLIEVNIDYSQSTYFSTGVIKTNFLRFPWKDRFRLVGRVVKRKAAGVFAGTG